MSESKDMIKKKCRNILTIARAPFEMSKTSAIQIEIQRGCEIPNPLDLAYPIVNSMFVRISEYLNIIYFSTVEILFQIYCKIF